MTSERRAEPAYACPQCAYLLWGTEAICPECGALVDWQAAPRDPARAGTYVYRARGGMRLVATARTVLDAIFRPWRMAQQMLPHEPMGHAIAVTILAVACRWGFDTWTAVREMRGLPWYAEYLSIYYPMFAIGALVGFVVIVVGLVGITRGVEESVWTRVRVCALFLAYTSPLWVVAMEGANPGFLVGGYIDYELDCWAWDYPIWERVHDRPNETASHCAAVLLLIATGGAFVHERYGRVWRFCAAVVVVLLGLLAAEFASVMVHAVCGHLIPRGSQVIYCN